MAGGMFSNFTSSMKGIFVDGAAEKAILYIYLVDISQKQEIKANVLDVRKQESALMKKAKKTLSITDDLKGLGSGFLDFFTPGAKSQQKVGKVDDDNDKFLKFEVQYNPATIRLSSVNGKVQEKRREEGVQDKLHVMKFEGKSKLSFDLIFDDCDNMNAFAFNDIANINFSSMANKAVSLLQNAGTTHSVRKRMDAIMSLLSSPSTQQVVFFWAKMVFRGTVTSVNNRFTMFNPEGNPIRGEMHLEITQDKKYKDKLYDEQYWQKAFKECFKEPSGGFDVEDAIAGVADEQSWMDIITNNPFLNI